MRIKEFSEKYHIDPRTIDYYSNVAKILPYKQGNKTNKYRDYDVESERAIKKILILRGIGLSIEEIKSILNDPSYFTQDRLEEHIESLKKKRDEEIQRYDEWISFAETLKQAKLRPLDVVGDYDVNVPVEIFTQIMASGEDMEDAAQALYDNTAFRAIFDSYFLPAFYRLNKLRNETPTSEKVQGIISQFCERLRNCPGPLLSLIFSPPPELNLNIFHEIFDEDDTELNDFTSQLAPLISDWCTKSESREKILDSESFKYTYETELVKLDQTFQDLFETDGSTVDELIMDILNDFLEDDLTLIQNLLFGVAIGTDIVDDTYIETYDKQFGEGFFQFFRSAILYYVNHSVFSIDSN